MHLYIFGYYKDDNNCESYTSKITNKESLTEPLSKLYSKIVKLLQISPEKVKAKC